MKAEASRIGSGLGRRHAGKIPTNTEVSPQWQGRLPRDLGLPGTSEEILGPLNTLMMVCPPLRRAVWT